jgi:hypothetical protein
MLLFKRRNKKGDVAKYPTFRGILSRLLATSYHK